MTRLWTIGSIAAAAGVQQHRVEYFVASRGIQPSGRAGRLRVFSDADAKFVVESLAMVKREGACHAS